MNDPHYPAHGLDPRQSRSSALGSRLKQVRSRLGLSLTDASELSGVSRAYISQLERGLGKRPGVAVIDRLEAVLGPLRDSPSATQDVVPAGLRRLAAERRIPEDEVALLAGIRVGGKQPLSAERWRLIYELLVSSEIIDERQRSEEG